MPVVFSFGTYQLDTETLELRESGVLVPVEPQVFSVLRHLVENRHRVVSKDELLQAVWGDPFVNESTLSGRILAARRAVGDSGSEQRWIKTVHGRGFRFVGPLKEDEPDMRILIADVESALGEARADKATAQLNHLEDLLHASDSPELDPLRADWHRLTAQCLVLKEGWSSEEAKSHYLESIRIAEGVGAVDIFRSARYHLATLLELRAEFDRSETLMSAAVCEATAEVDTEALELLACSLFHQGRFAECIERAERGTGTCEVGDRRLSAFYGESPGVSCNYWLALSLWFIGREAEALQHASRALRLSEEPGRIFCLAHARQQAAFLHQIRKDRALCEHWASAAQAIGQRQGLLYRESVANILLGWARGSEDQLPAMRQSLSTLEAMGAAMELPYLRAVLAESELSLGRLPDALHSLDLALESCSTSRGYFYRAEIMRLRAETLRQDGKPASDIGESLEAARNEAKSQGAMAIVARCDEDLERLATLA